MISQYLKDLGIKKSDVPWHWLQRDKRQKEWKQEQKIHGFDNRDTWCLDYTIALLIYTRLKMFNEVNNIDTVAETVTLSDGSTPTLQTCINIILCELGNYIKNYEKDQITMAEHVDITDTMKLLAEIYTKLWW